MAACALLPCAVFGQSPGVPPKFDIADVHASARIGGLNPGTNGMRSGFGHGRYELRAATMVDLIGAAWGVDAERVLGGPSWLELDRFDVVARTSADSTPDTLRTMLRTLLADRFALAIHSDTRPVQAYVLSMSTNGGNKGSKLRKADGLGDAACEPEARTAPLQPIGMGSVPFVSYSCHNMTMASFAERIESMAGAYLDGNVVLDGTGLGGAWDFNIKWTARSNLKAAGPDGVTLFDAVDKQLGVKLALSTVALPVIVVDGANRKPTENLPGVAESLPALPVEFEAAEIKRSGRDSVQRGSPFEPGGRVELRNYTLNKLIAIAWGIDSLDMIAGAPGFADKVHFDIVAEASGDPPAPGTPIPQPPDVDALRAMLRALLADRFRLAVHTEERPVIVYTLTAVKPKLRKANPSDRTACKQTGTRIANVFTCRNTTMSQLALQLPGFSPGDLAHPVVDATGIDGAWDFTLSFSPAVFARGGLGQSAYASRPASGVPVAADPVVALTLMEAVDRQLGLKLVPRKGPQPVLVIDHLEEKPTDN